MYLVGWFLDTGTGTKECKQPLLAMIEALLVQVYQDFCAFLALISYNLMASELSQRS